MNIGCIVQARMNSTRLPGKVLMDLGGKPVLWHVLQRTRQIGIPVIVAVPKGSPKELLEVATRGQAIFSEGPEDDVLARYYYTAKVMGMDTVMRICGDQPLLDPAACTTVLEAFKALYVDWCSNDYYPSYPIGLGCEIYTVAALELAFQQARKPHDREHVVPWITRHSQFTGRNIRCPINGLSSLRLTIDTQEDLDFVRRIDAAGPKDFSLQSTLEALNRVKASDLATGTDNRQQATG